MTMPNFLIIGAQKSGTTSLYHYLKQHPEIYMSPVKEPNFFALEGENLDFRGPGNTLASVNNYSITAVEDYRQLFREVSEEKAVGEASNLYLYSSKAPKRIRHHIPDAKLIAVLRNPVQRAYSSFLHCIRDDREPLTDFSEALGEEERRIRENWGFLWHYKQIGFYHVQLKRYFEEFGHEQLRIHLYEDFEADSLGVLRDIFRFLGVDERFTPNMSIRYNMSGIPRSRTFHSLLSRRNPIKTAIKPLLPIGMRRRLSSVLKSRNLDVAPQLSPEMCRELAKAYREDTLRLQELIRRDLSGWLL